MIEVLSNEQLTIPLRLDAYGASGAGQELGATETYPTGVGFPNGATICIRAYSSINEFLMQGYFAK